MIAEKRKLVRCAVYTRKSTEEGLEQEFNSLDAQREAAENYINSQKGEGWICLPAHYDDGGFSGGNTERPALKQMLADIENGLIDCCVVYKVDRLSRSLLDFAGLIGTFDKHGVTFVSVTQQFNTTTSMGRLTLNILLSFAQFEREIIGERIRDKVAAAKKKGKHTGGAPILGYDIDNSKLVVVPAEAKLVREVFRRFLILRSLVGLARELNGKGITGKSWTTQKGKKRPGPTWTKNSIYRLLTNRKYIGEITHHGVVYPGEQEAIVEKTMWEQTQAIFAEDAHMRGCCSRRKIPALLKGILQCGHCGGSMGITYTKQRGRIYRYYLCLAASKKGYDVCPVKTVPANEIEGAVVDQLRGMLRSPEVLAKAQIAAGEEDAPADRQEVTQALHDVDAVWEHLFPAEQARICRLLIERIILRPDGMEMHLHRCGIGSLVGEITSEEENDENKHGTR